MPVVIRQTCLASGPLETSPPMPPATSVAAELDSDDKATRGAALEQIDGYLGELERWAWAAESSCR